MHPAWPTPPAQAIAAIDARDCREIARAYHALASTTIFRSEINANEK